MDRQARRTGLHGHGPYDRAAMDTNPDDQATIAVLCVQARIYSETIARARDDVADILRGMRESVTAMERSGDPRMRQVAAEVRDLIASTHADLMRSLR